LVDGLVVQYQSEVWEKKPQGGGGEEEIEQSQLKQEQVESIDELGEDSPEIGWSCSDSSVDECGHHNAGLIAC
jgi:hypothetical protein